jgi:Fis family transcriptional regulator, factor for inversion stimulation protein
MLTDDWPTLDVLRLRYIAHVLEQHGGSTTRAAEVLGIDRRTLTRILSRERAKQAAAARFPVRLVTLRPKSSPAPG